MPLAEQQIVLENIRAVRENVVSIAKMRKIPTLKIVSRKLD
jgi:hypothetical protein